jgi:hypothetical protein
MASSLGAAGLDAISDARTASSRATPAAAFLSIANDCRLPGGGQLPAREKLCAYRKSSSLLVHSAGRPSAGSEEQVSRFDAPM